METAHFRFVYLIPRMWMHRRRRVRRKTGAGGEEPERGRWGREALQARENERDGSLSGSSPRE